VVDPNPARGMPIQLQRYWLVGKGATKIRWNTHGDFLRCVRALRSKFPKNPEGLCNILHTKATGGPPGHGSLEKHSITASFDADPIALVAAQALMDRQPKLGNWLWAGPLAPIGLPTGEPRRTRIFEPGSLSHRVLPLPMDWRPTTGQGHDGAMTVGRILGLTYGPDHMGQDYAWGWGDYLDEDIVPEAKRARYLADQGVAGPSVDPGGQVVASLNPMNGFEHMQRFTIGGATLVSIPAFAALRQMVFEADGDWPEDDPDMDGDYAMSDEDCGCDGALVASVNPKGWRGLPLAPREAVFDNDDAVKRITAWAQGGQDVEKMRRAFMYYDPQGSPNDPTSYRLPVGDVINGRLTLIYHAIYAAAALLSGAHGGLPNVPETDIAELRNVISEIYPEMATAFNDSSVRAPWDRSAQEGVQLAMDTYAATEPYGDVNYADPGYRDNKKRYPIDSPEHVRAAWSYINQAKNAEMYDTKQLAQIKARIVAAAKKHGVQITDEMAVDRDQYSTTGFPVYPPKEWFEDPQLRGKTRLTVTDDGHVFGHLAAWNECHRDMANRECVMAPRSRQGYAPFHLGTVVTREGEVLPVGKIVMDTRHAGIHLGYTAAAVHYDNTGDEVAVIRCGEDEYGIWFSGAVVPEADERKVAKLRRSPLSGDWRREKGSLELTAALAVNAPAFPVYAMEDDERMALVAAGSVYESDDVPQFVPPTGIIAAAEAYVEQVFASQDQEAAERAQRLKDLLEDDEILAQRRRAARLSHVFSVDPTIPAPAPAPGAGPVAPGAAPGAAPAPAAAGADPNVDGQSATDAAGMDEVAWQIAAEADASFAVIGEGGAPAATEEAAGAPAQEPAVAPTPQAPAPAGQTVPLTQG
jgi:hypothetical protein